MLSFYRQPSFIFLDRTGWTHVQPLKELVNPSFLAFDRDRRFLYVVHGDQTQISSFAIDQKSGTLSFLNRRSTGGSNPVHLVIDPTNRFVIVANYETGSLAVLPRSKDGTLGDVVQVVQLPGQPGPHKTQQKGSHPHDVPFDNEARFILVPDKGLDGIFTFRLDTDAGKLIPGTTPFTKAREGSGTRHIAFHPNGRFGYVVNELDSSVTTYRYDSETGKLAPLQILPITPSTFTGDNTGAEIAVDESGKFVYVSNRGHDSIAGFRIDSDSGTLTAIGWTASEGKGPRFFAIAPGNKYLYAANENSDTIVAFAIDPSSGRLAPTGEVIPTGSPVCIVFTPAPEP
jgi:6-phosphogluconolactonase (cycloisomerase 2 family)